MDIDNKTAVAAGGIVATILGWCANKLYGNLSHRIKNAHDAGNMAAQLAASVEERRREDMIAVHARLGEHIEKDHAMHAKILDKLANIPTRDEMHEFIQRAVRS